ncbi:MAG: hypothetical protein R3F14_19925 [Polyangiaceae bacterium]
MSLDDDVWLLCEGEPRSRDVRWLNLVLAELANSSDLAARVRVMPSGSKADLAASVRGVRAALGSSQVYAVRDRDFLRAEILDKDTAAGVHALRRHCIESYLVEPQVLERALGISNAEEKLDALARERFYPDLGRAVLDALGYEIRRDRPRLGDRIPSSTGEVVAICADELKSFWAAGSSKDTDIAGLVRAFEEDMRADALWTRVNGKELMKSLAKDLNDSIPGGRDLESALFHHCSQNTPPEGLTAEIERILNALPLG